MREDFLWYVWRYQKFTSPLFSVDGQEIKVIKTGFLNEVDGPDFQEAELRIDNISLHGSVECHLKSSDWLAHKHDNSPKYNNVMLHVVWENNVPVPSLDEHKVPVVELKDFVDKGLLDGYQQFLESKDKLPCSFGLENVPSIIKRSTLERALIHRMEQKVGEVSSLIQQLDKDYNQLIWTWLLRCFGFSNNQHAFVELANFLPVKLLMKHSNCLLSIEALLLGTAGFLEEGRESPWHKEYSFLAQKYELNQVNKTVWNYGRIRPSNFPEIRLSQLANLLHNTPEVLHFVDADISIKDWMSLLGTKASDYWNDHSHIGVMSSVSKQKNLGKSSKQNLVINYIVPLLVYISERQQKAELKTKAFSLLEQLPAENNSVCRTYEEHGFENDNAFDSQSLIGLYKDFCTPIKCLQCGIGVSLMNKGDA